MPQCDRCGSDSVEHAITDGNLTCLGCGKVLDESQNYRNEVDLVTTGGRARACGSVVSLISDGITASTSVPRNNSVHRRSHINPVQKWIETIGNQLKVGETMLQQMYHTHACITMKKDTSSDAFDADDTHDTPSDSPPEKYTRSPDLFAAAIVYIVLRQNSKPYTLLDVSQVIQKNIFMVGRVYDLILRRNRNEIQLNEVHPSIFIDKVCSQINHVTLPDMATIKKYANQIINLIKPQWVHTGKRLDAVCVAAIYIAAEAVGCSSNMKDLCHAIKAGEGTAKNRTREIKNELLQITVPKLPWMKDVKVKDLPKHLGKMLSQLETMARLAETKPAHPLISLESTSCTAPPSTTLPSNNNNDNNNNVTNYLSTNNTPYIDEKPDLTEQKMLPGAFLNNMAARARRQHKLENAKRRLRESLDGDPELKYYCLPSVLASIEALPRLIGPPPPPPLVTQVYPLAPVYKKGSPPSTPQTPPIKSPSSTSPTSSPSTPPLPSSPSTPPSMTFAQLAHSATQPAKTKPLSLRRRAKTESKEEKEQKAPIVLPDLDHEDLIIEKLLMNGISEDQILDGYYFTELISEVNKHPSFHSEAVGEDDIPDSEMSKFIRSPAEVDVLTKFEEKHNLSEGGEDKPKKKKATSGKRRRVDKAKNKKEEEEEKAIEQEGENVLDSESEAGEETLQDARKRHRAAAF